MVIESHIVPADAPRQRLSDYAVGIFAALPSRKGLKKAIKRGAVTADDRVVGTGHWVLPGQVLALSEWEQAEVTPYRMELPVVYEDNFLAVVNKPGGIPVSGNQFRTIEHALSGHLTLSEQADAYRRFRPVHRLDSATCGLLMIAKTVSASAHLGQQLAAGKVEKAYRAIVIGKLPEQGTMDTPINNKASLTTFVTKRWVRSLRYDWLSLVELYPKTGRTHQLRIHLATAGFPILGDRLYGQAGQIKKGKGLLLCAKGLRFTHPHTGQMMRLDIEPPNKFASILRRAQARWDLHANN